jgi:cobyrinic acid a,c-diamide synthase
MPYESSKSLPRVIIAGTSGDSGKTLVTVGLIAGLRRRGYSIAAFKKGPDFIDPAWLNAASGGPVRNLDTFLAPERVVYESFTRHALESGLNLIEGNRGLYDGFDAQGSHSTAELAKLLKTPVVLVCNITKSTRTVAAVILGMKVMDPGLNIAGVIINQVGGKRHKNIVTESIENITGIPVIGAIPRVKGETLLPSRHLGLITPVESSGTDEMVRRLGKLISDNVDLDRLIEIAEKTEKLEYSEEHLRTDTHKAVKIGYFSDSAFTFYYPENLESLISEGAELIPISSLEANMLPEIDALYIGGGFPETHAGKLAGNRELMASVRQMADSGLPIYAECGGLIYLCHSLTIDQTTFPMADVFDVDLEFKKAPQGHGYSLMEVDRDNPFFPLGAGLRGHEFHYTTPSRVGPSLKTVLKVRKGSGFYKGRDALVKNNVWAGYLHIHASGETDWAANLVKLARAYKASRGDSQAGSGPSFMERKAV